MRQKPDYILLLVVGLLILLGIIILTSVSTALSQDKFGSPGFYLFHHLVFGLLPGILLGFLAFKIPLALFRKWASILLLVNAILLILVFVPKIGMTFGGAASWINLRFFSFQPSEFLKLIFILYLATWLTTRTEKGKKTFSETLIAFFAVIGLISLLLALQPDVGTLGIVVIIGILMYFLAGTPLKHSFLIIIAGLAGLAALIKFEPYRLNRLLVFLNSETEPMGMGFQIKQALITVGSGGILGKGLGMSLQKFGFLPQPMADSIFAIFSEEAGLVGGVILIVLFLMLAWRGFEIAKKTHDNFYRLTALGITSWIVLQAFVNIGSMVGISPLTGIPLPFVSYGGSALVTELIGIGILLNISKKNVQKT